MQATFIHKRIVTLMVALLLCTPLLAQRNLKKSDIPNPDPELERKTFQIAPGFEVNLFAGDPRIAKPIHMNFDARGRLWIASSSVYPHIKPGQKATDKILVIEDTNGDGKGDRTTVFADDLLIPTGIVPGDGGVYVVNSTELLFLKDTNGDGKADQRKVVLSGFGAEDTHHLLHTLRWGPDGSLYMNQSIYIHSHVETPRGVKHLNGGGIWRFRPETMKLNIVCHGFVNPWGHHFDRWGQQFATDGAYGEGINYVFPGAVYVASPGRPRRLRGLNPGSPKHCGLEILSGRHLPKSIRGSMVTNDFRAHRVCRFVVTEDGSGYASRQEVELIKTKHIAFRPIDVKMGPDGAIYIADWYNPIIQHGEVDFRDPRRDHVHGRIWRITAKGRPLVKKAKLVGAPTSELLNHLKAPEQWVRLHAKLLLKHRDRKKTHQQLKHWLAGLDKKDPDYWHHQLEGLWVCQCLRVVDKDQLLKVYGAPDDRLRATAIRTLNHWRDKLPKTLVNRLLGDSVSHRHPRVRLEAVRALTDQGTAGAARVAARALRYRMDRFLDFAVWRTLRQLQDKWIARLQDNQVAFERVEELVYALRVSNHPKAMPTALSLIQSEDLALDHKNPLIELVGRIGNARDVSIAARSLLSRKPKAIDVATLNSLVATTSARRIRPNQAIAARLMALFDSQSEPLRVAAIRAAGNWQAPGALAKLKAQAQSGKTASVRHAAMEGIALLDRRAAIPFLQSAATKSPNRRDQVAATVSLMGLDVNIAAQNCVRLLQSSKSPSEPGRLLSALLSRRGGANAVRAKLAGKTLPVDVAKRSVRAVQLSATRDANLIKAIRTAGKLADAGWTLTPKLMQSLVAEVRKSGNAIRGEAVYRRSEMQCIKCHSIAGSGGKVGPDLISIGASAPIDYLIESLIEPNKKIKENFHSLVIQTDKGKVYTGIPVQQSKQVVVLRTAEGATIRIPTATIDVKQQGRSLMAQGAVDSLTRNELVDLTRFLSELGKVGRFAVSKAEIARTWEALLPTPAGIHRIRRSSFDSVAKGDKAFKWHAAFSRVSGQLPTNGLPVLRDATYVTKRGRSRTSFVRCRLNVTSDGKVELVLGDTAGLSMWIDGNPVAINKSIVRSLKRGTHSIAMAIDRTKRTGGIKLTLKPVGGSKAQAKFQR